MNLRVIDPAKGILKIDLHELARSRRVSRRNDMRPPPLWVPGRDEPIAEGDNSTLIIPPPEGHDPAGRNRR